MTVQAIPEGYRSVTPYLICKHADEALAYYQQAFGAEEILKLEDSQGGIMHAEIQIGDCRLMMADEFPDMGAISPQTLGGAGVSFCLYVEDCDAAFAKALAAGGEVLRPVADQFYGDRSGTMKDPFGHTWTIATHIEDLSQEEIERRAAAMG